MDNKIRLQYDYRMEGHYTIGSHDTSFYRQLPEVKEEYRDTQGRPAIPLPSTDVLQVLQIIGTTVLTSQALAQIIISYLRRNRSRIRIREPNGAEVEYEGPNFSKDQPAVVDTIEKMQQRAGSASLIIVATSLPPVSKR